MLETVRGAVRRLQKILNSAFECDYYYYYYVFLCDESVTQVDRFMLEAVSLGLFLAWVWVMGNRMFSRIVFFFFFFFFFCVPQLYLWGSPLLGEIFAYVTVFF